MLNTGVGLTAACTVVGAWLGASAFFNDDMNIHKAVFVDTLNTSPGKRSHTTWGSNTSGNWGSITVNRTYLVKGVKCSEYESVVVLIDNGHYMVFKEKMSLVLRVKCLTEDGIYNNEIQYLWFSNVSNINIIIN